MSFAYLLIAVVLWVAWIWIMVNSQKIKEGVFAYLAFVMMTFAAHFSATFTQKEYGSSYDLFLGVFIAIPMLYMVWLIFQSFKRQNQTEQ